MNNAQQTIKAKYQWTEAMLFIGMFAVVASTYAAVMQIQESKATAIASQKPTCSWDEKVAATVPLISPTSNVLSNHTMESASTEGDPGGWMASGWGDATFSASYIQDEGRSGSTSLKIEMSEARNGGAAWQPKSAVLVKPNAGYVFENYYRSDVDTSVVAEVTLRGGDKRFIQLGTSEPSQAWVKHTYTFVTPDKAIKAVVYQVIDGKGFIQTDDYHLSEYQPEALSQGMVSLTFDDGAEQIYTHALPLLEKYDIDSTQYVVTKPIPKKHSGYYINTDQLTELAEKGHEIGSHTHSHANLAQVSASQSQAEMIDAQKSLYELLGQTAPNFATPYGSYDQRVIDQAKKFYCSHRSTDIGYNSPDYFDLYNIRVQNVTLDTSVEEVTGWIDYANQHKVWLVIVFHEVGYEGGHYSYTPENLEKVLQHLKKSTINAVTMSEGIILMQAAQNDLQAKDDQGDTLSTFTTVPFGSTTGQ